MTTVSINPSRVDFVTLRLFCAVAQTGSITKGAASCHLALSAASRRLRDFEASVGVPLLERSAQGIALTPAGHVALQHAIRLFQGFELFGSELQDFSRGIKGHVRLWANMSALTEFLPSALASFVSLHPEIRIEVEEQLSGDIVRALVDGIADIGVFAAGTPTHGLRVRHYRADELVVLCPKGHPLSKSRRTDFRNCLRYEFVGLNRGSSLLELTSRSAEDAGLALRLRVQVRSFDALCHMVAAGLGIGVAPLDACRSQVKALDLRVVRLTDTWANRAIMIASKVSEELSSAAKRLLAHLEGDGRDTRDPSAMAATGGR